MKQTFLILILFGFFTKASAQSSPNYNVQKNFNAWFMYFGNHKLSDKWGVHLEAQLRRSNFVSNAQQVLLRAGINYHAFANTFFSAGYCYVYTYPYGVFPSQLSFPENRLWQQVQIKNQISRYEIISRSRLEQRFVYMPQLNAYTNKYELGEAIYTNRARILNRLSMPFYGKNIVDKSIYITAFNESFINFGKNIGKNIFDQNRVYLALGYKVPKYGRLELGYMQQNILKSDGVKLEKNATFQIAFSSTLDFYNVPK